MPKGLSTGTCRQRWRRLSSFPSASPFPSAAGPFPSGARLSFAFSSPSPPWAPIPRGRLSVRVLGAVLGLREDGMRQGRARSGCLRACTSPQRSLLLLARSGTRPREHVAGLRAGLGMSASKHIFWLVYLDFCSSLWQCFCRIFIFTFFAVIKVLTDRGNHLYSPSLCRVK